MALSGRGFDIALVEPQPLDGRALPEPAGISSFDARVSALTPVSSNFLESLASWQTVLDYRACAYRHMTVWDADGTGGIEFDCEEVGAPALGHIVENRAIVSALADNISKARDITLYNPDSVEAVLPVESEESISLQLASGATLETSLVVAADGARSALRGMFEFETREWDYGHRAIVCTVQTEDSHQATAWQRFTPDGPLAFLPLAGEDDRCCSIVWSLRDAVAEEMAGLDDAAFCEALGWAFEKRLGSVVAATRRVAFPLRQRHAVDYVQPRVALVGDAAHTIHPLAGQGINLGLADVAVLAEEIQSAASRGLDVGALSVLRRYQRRRKGDNLAMMVAMDGFKRLFEQDSLPLRWLRNEGMRLVGRATPVKRQLMRQAMGL